MADLLYGNTAMRKGRRDPMQKWSRWGGKVWARARMLRSPPLLPPTTAFFLPFWHC